MSKSIPKKVNLFGRSIPMIVIVIIAGVLMTCCCLAITMTQEQQPTNTTEEVNKSGPTNTPKPTDTPRATNTPKPTNTPTSTPTPLPEPEIFEGSGDAIIDREGSGPALVHIDGNASGRHFAVKGIDSNNEMVDLLVNTTDPYNGIRPLDFMQDEKTVRLEINASDSWSIEIVPLSIDTIPILEIPGKMEGQGDYVFAIQGGTPDLAIINGNASGQYFGVFGYGSGKDLLVNTTDPYEGTVILDNDTFIFVVNAVGDWGIEVKTK